MLQFPNQLVIFTLDDRRYGLPLSTVDRIVRVVDITPLPKAPGIVLGVINVQGQIIPVINVRRRFRLPEREIVPAYQLIVARAARRPVALLVDAAAGVIGYPNRTKGEDITVETRIRAVADVIEAMGSHGPYHPTVGIEVALDAIANFQCLRYDQNVVDACMQLFRDQGVQSPR